MYTKLQGIAILLKSLFDKLLSPIIFIGNGDLTKMPHNSRPRVAEFCESIISPFLYL